MNTAGAVEAAPVVDLAASCVLEIHLAAPGQVASIEIDGLELDAAPPDMILVQVIPDHAFAFVMQEVHAVERVVATRVVLVAIVFLGGVAILVPVAGSDGSNRCEADDAGADGDCLVKYKTRQNQCR